MLDMSAGGGISPAEEAAICMRLLRRSCPPLAGFARRLSAELGRPSLSRQAVYDWERGRTRIPAEALIAAARVAGLPLAEARAAAGAHARTRRMIRLAGLEVLALVRPDPLAGSAALESEAEPR